MSNKEGFSLAGGRLIFPSPQERVREYCELEVYSGYDDFHAIDNIITKRDIEATKRLFSMIDQHGYEESSSILKSTKIPTILAEIPDTNLAEIPDSTWIKEKTKITQLLRAFLEINGVGLAKTFKILHLKRPHLLPILDSYVVEFLTGTAPSSITDKEVLISLGINALEIARSDILRNYENLQQIQLDLADLPIPLTIVRLYDILCWTTWKWDILRIKRTTKWIQTAYGYTPQKSYASKTLLNQKEVEPLRKVKETLTRKTRTPPTTSKIDDGCFEINTEEQFDNIVGQVSGFVVVTDSTGNKIHKVSCRWLKKDYFVEKVITNRKKQGRYFWCRDYEYGRIRFGAKNCRTCI